MTPLERAVPEWTDHPVDVLKWFAERAGRKLDPETEARYRAICDEPIEADAALKEGEMKRDMDLVRQILIVGEEWHAAVIPVFQVSGFDNQTIDAHVQMLAGAGYLAAVKSSGGGHSGWRITWDGYEFLGEVRDPEIWKKTKEGAEKVGSWSIKLLGELASGLIRAKAVELGLPLA